MVTLALVGFVGGLITGISPCILPVLPVVFFSGAHGGATVATTQTGVSTPDPKAARVQTRPYRVIAGLVLSFCLVTLTGSALLSLLHLRQDTIRWVALAALVAIGLGLIFPRLEQWLQRPFSRIPHNSISAGGTGFGLGLALGVLYVPCAGPVLTAIILAGATARIGLNTVVLTCAFALGTALPLLFFALAGRETAGRVSAFRRRQREIRIGAGVVTILLAVALVLNLPATLQRAIPDYTSALQGLPEQVGGPNQIGTNLGGIGGLVTDQNAQLSNCTNGAAQPQDCGSAPDITGISGWLNTPEHQPIRLSSLRGRVVLVDFWAYSCINCQRAIPHVVGWYRAYKDSGLEVIGVHTPEYAFEKVPENVAAGAADLNITYPIALDNNYSTWTNYRNAYWPAEYLIDASGTVRHIKFGEGDYDGTENLIRRLLTDANPGAKLPAPVDAADTTPALSLTPETYFGVGKAVNFAGSGYDQGSATFSYPLALPPDTFALQGPWSLDHQRAAADGDDCRIKLNYLAKNVYLVVGGTGTLTVTGAGKSTTLRIGGAPTSHQIVAGDQVQRTTIEVHPSKGLQVYSFTYG
ncbi:cytochrome c biogenesis protein DipZ [Mycobacterium marinum]|uniref:cytochrome c biogenesis protein DipZ n=1 Tax=Mycobacterium marinum TaxID=1781 RepID=UPI002340345E|nr:cytochrome c biogenesis protein DipZ [Mycobacterium marinum]MDC8997307.1 cytochrome c biogenesis protein DipZ [Mycobacterium marinum]WDZ15626.1 cytochrome c biogenesis protein DipZ [Mycobacterium marinum]